jgi:PKD repeat protein
MFTWKNIAVSLVFKNHMEKAIFPAVLLLLAAALTACGEKAAPSAQAIQNGEPFHPQESVIIQSGEYVVPDVDIPEGVEVRFEGDASLSVTGDMKLSGAISGDCRDLDFNVGGNLELSGSLDNPCGDGEGGDINLHVETGITNPNSIGPVINTDGDLTISVGLERENWEMDILPSLRADEETAPVCSASSDTTSVYLAESGVSVVSLSGKGIDPDGGPVRYLWSFHDGSQSSDQNPEYSFTKPGKKSIYLEVADDEGQTCSASMTISIPEGEIETEQPPGLAIRPEALVVEQGVPVWVEIISDLTDEAEFEWRVDDSVTAVGSELTFSEPGRFEVGLTARSASGETAEAAAIIYVYPAVETASTSPHNASPRKAYNCAAANPPDVLLLGRILNGATARNITFSWGQPLGPSNLMIEPTANITAKAGENGFGLVMDGAGNLVPEAAKGAGIVDGKKGGDGGNITIINYLNDIVVCGGATLTAGNGGDGQDAIADSRGNAYRTAVARGGKGGNAGGIQLTAANLSGRIIVQGLPNVTYNLGNGGKGGHALAYGGDGKDDCKSPTRGGNAIAEGGKGGSASYTQTGRYQSIGGGQIIVVSGATAGDGGNAAAIAGKGGSAVQPGGDDCTGLNCANGADGGTASAAGGRGGDAIHSIKPGVVIRAAFKGGNGGTTRAEGGHGGDGGTCCDRKTGATGGMGGWAREAAGRFGKGKVNGNGGGSFVGRSIDICGLSVDTSRGTGEGGNGGNGGDGAKTGGKMGMGGSGINIPKGDNGVNGKICLTVLQLDINGIDVAFDAGKPGHEITIRFTAKNWNKKNGAPVDKVVILDGDKKLEIPLKASDVVEGKSITITIPGDRNIEKTLRIKLVKNDIESKEAKVEIRTQEKTPTSSSGNAPSVVSLEFPLGNFHREDVIDWKTTIAADGSDATGRISFTDPDGDATYIYFTPLEADSKFSPFGFYLRDLSSEDIEGDLSDGAALFWIGCDGPGDHSLSAAVQDETGLWSKYFTFAFKCR